MAQLADYFDAGLQLLSAVDEFATVLLLTKDKFD
jgi:hypothetical protein